MDVAVGRFAVDSTVSNVVADGQLELNGVLGEDALTGSALRRSRRLSDRFPRRESSPRRDRRGALAAGRASSFRRHSRRRWRGHGLSVHEGSPPAERADQCPGRQRRRREPSRQQGPPGEPRLCRAWQKRIDFRDVVCEFSQSQVFGQPPSPPHELMHGACYRS